jgi:hypothetical protein
LTPLQATFNWYQKLVLH